ncbi:sensor histidine kinase [Polaromonas sp.]|uniref:sensor histidine kinase n=1 Tax=Polaromonas sp. TaxID=1869339 RepID=UPI003265BAE7
MKRATTACWRTSAGVVQALALVAALLAGTGATAQPGPYPVIHYTTAQMLEAPGPAGPLEAVVDADALGTPWREVALPYAFARQIIPQGGTPRVTTRWFRVQVSGMDQPGDTAHFYLKRWQTAGQLAVYADGRLVFRSLGSPAWNLFRHPGVFIALNQSARMAAPTDILVRMDSLQGAGGGLSSFYVGNTQALLSHYTVREWLEYQLPFMSSAAFLVIGIFCFFVWLWRRKDPLYLLLAAFSVLQVLRRWHFHTGLERLPVSDAWFGWITLNALSWQIMIVHAFLLLLHRRPMPRLTWTLLALTSVFTVCTLPGVLPLPALVLLRPALQLLQISLVLIVIGVGLWHSVRSRSLDGVLLSGSNCVALGFGIYDWLKAQQLIDMEWFYLTPYGATLLLATFMFIMLRRYVQAIGEVEQMNASLEQRLKGREAELAQSYERLRKVEHEHMLSSERQRMMQDMHDGLGSSLTSAIRSVEHGAMSDAEVTQVLKDCMDDLKLAIDSMEPAEADLLLLLATLRFRLAPRIKSAGVSLVWEVQELPALDWLDPSAALHILRIVQESVANILRHTRATEIRVSTATEGAGVQVIIEDNGQGFDVENALNEATGRGLSNQQRRAQAIDGTVAWTSGPAGTRFTLWLPLQRAASVAVQSDS